MATKGLTIGIDYTDEYCQACYYSERHGGPESVSGGTELLRYLIPSVLVYDPEKNEWAIGNSALRMEENPGMIVFRELMRNVRAGTTAFVAGKMYSYTQLMAVYFGKLLEFIQIRTSVMAVSSITVTMKYVDLEIKTALEEVFRILQVPTDRVRLLSNAESFGYYIINEEPQLWQEGALLFDFSSQGFFVKHMNVQFGPMQPLIYVNEYDFSGDFHVGNLGSQVLREQMDERISNLYTDLMTRGGCASVFFTGEGFDEQWFVSTLRNISGTCRAFKGNNIYVKGACIAGYMREQGVTGEFSIICSGRTRASIYLEAWDHGDLKDILLSPAACDWYDAGYEGDFILENERAIAFTIVSVITGARDTVEMDLGSFPARPSKTTRVQINISYRNEYECEITITDKGFGELYADGGAVVSKTLNLEGYI